MKNLNKVVEILRGVAPTVATVLGGPMAGVAVKALANNLTGNPDATVDEVEAAVIGAAPADLVKLKQVEADLKVALSDAGLQLEDIAARDRDSARERQVATKDRTPAILAGVVVLGFFGVLVYVILNGMPQASGPVVALLMGSLATGLGQVLNFYFGSSVGSKNKDAVIAGITRSI